jgi:hypothetical protein
MCGFFCGSDSGFFESAKAFDRDTIFSLELTVFSVELTGLFRGLRSTRKMFKAFRKIYEASVSPPVWPRNCSHVADRTLPGAIAGGEEHSADVQSLGVAVAP